jgi:5-methylthioribose kinase
VTESATDNYRTLSVDTVVEYLRSVENVASLLGDNVDDWSVSEIGDGNLNLVFLVQSPNGSVIAKQALPYLRVRGEGWPLPLSRAFFEYEALTREEKRAEGMTPQVLHFDRDMALTVMEFLSPHIILRKGLVGGIQYPRLANDLGLFLARTLFRGSDFSMNAAEKRADVALFAGNDGLCAVTEARVFTEPYFDAELNRWTSPQLDEVVTRIRSDSLLKVAVHEMKTIFMSKSQSLLHGDLHSGSVMVTEHNTRVIDPEFAFYGPMGFDIGALLGNYLLAYIAQSGQATGDEDRIAYSNWMLKTVEETWTMFDNEFRNLWQTERTGDLFPSHIFGDDDADETERALTSYLKDVLEDSIGFAAAKMMRRVIGAAHVEDLESIADPNRRAECEKRVLSLARRLILNRKELSGIGDVVALTRETGN